MPWIEIKEIKKIVVYMASSVRANKSRETPKLI